MKKNNHITDLDAIELSSAWNYNSNISINDEINVNGSMYNVIKHQQLTDMRLILSELIFTEYVIVEMQDFFKNALLSDSLLRDIKVLSANAKGDADMLETELHAVINAMSQNEGKSVDALKNSTAFLKNNLTKLKEQLDKTTH
ncbi:lipoprotein [Staphylococcus schweitzeri]|nr:lipoprotein [Staphylococcus schweitzeri]VEE67110.1 Uncharacterised protein [Staphylococcus schweitzeri]